MINLQSNVDAPRIAWQLALLTLLVSLAGCGGSGSSSDELAARGSGTVGILLTDAPADPDQFVAINVTIEAIHLLGEDGKVEIFSGPAETHDLLGLTHEAVPFGFHQGVPAGEYCKIRLTLSDLELVLADDTPDDASDNETVHPHLPGNGKLDLLARDCFEVEPGGVLTLQIDMDAGKSIHVVKNNKRFNFRPVVFVDVIEGDFSARLLRLDGILRDFDEAGQTLLLCEALPTTWHGSEGCASLSFGDDAAFFDNETQGGAPRPIAELIAEQQIGKPLTVVGRPRYGALPPPPDVVVPPGQLPPAGQCRIWAIGVDPAQQPAPIDCDEVTGPLPDGTVLVSDRGVEHDPWLPLLRVEVIAAELGEFLQVGGRVEADADADGFELDPDEGGEFAGEGPLSVMLQADGVDFNGTRIVTKDGELLDFNALTALRSVQIDGVTESTGGAEPLLKAAIVIVNPAITANSESLSGVVLTVSEDGIGVDPDADTVCGESGDDFAVGLGGEPDMFTVTISATGSEVAPGGELAPGQTVGISGRCEAGGYEADSLVIVDDQRP